MDYNNRGTDIRDFAEFVYMNYKLFEDNGFELEDEMMIFNDTTLHRPYLESMEFDHEKYFRVIITEYEDGDILYSNNNPIVLNNKCIMSFIYHPEIKHLGIEHGKTEQVFEGDIPEKPDFLKAVRNIINNSVKNDSQGRSYILTYRGEEEREDGMFVINYQLTVLE